MADETETQELPAVAEEPKPAPRQGVQVTIHAPGRRFVIGLTSVLVLAVVAAGAFFVGQSTRKSESTVARETTHTVNVAVKSAVTKAVTDAVAKKGADDKAKRLRIMHRETTRINARHRAEVKVLRKVADRKADRAFSSGSVVGREAGYNDGVDDGITEASDELSCSDDSDVPLPYC